MLSDRKRCRLLSDVWMGGASIHFQFRNRRASEPVMWNHPAYRTLDDVLRTIRAQLFRGKPLLIAGILRVRHVLLVGFFLTGKHTLGSVDNDDKVTGIHVRREFGIVLATEDVRGLNGDATNHLAVGVNYEPTRRLLFFLSHECLHKNIYSTSEEAQLIQPARRSQLSKSNTLKLQAV